MASLEVLVAGQDAGCVLALGAFDESVDAVLDAIVVTHGGSPLIDQYREDGPSPIAVDTEPLGRAIGRAGVEALADE